MPSNDGSEGDYTSRLYPNLRQPWTDFQPANENEEEQESAPAASNM